MRPIGVVQGEIHPGGEEDILCGTGYDETNILR